MESWVGHGEQRLVDVVDDDDGVSAGILRVQGLLEEEAACEEKSARAEGSVKVEAQGEWGALQSRR